MEGDASVSEVSDATQNAHDIAMENVAQTAKIPDDKVMDESAAADLGSQSLNDLGVSVMDQDVLERNVAAQVSAPIRVLADHQAESALSKREDELDQKRLEKAQAKKEYLF